jgi:hypothetical protein
MVDQPREEKHPADIKPVRDAMIGDRPDAGVDQDFPSRPGGGVARLDRVQIFDEVRNEHGSRKLQSAFGRYVFHRKLSHPTSNYQWPRGIPRRKRWFQSGKAIIRSILTNGVDE